MQFHRDPYPAISPSRPELSQAGKTILITGGSDGIGFAISKAFIEASAAKVVIIGRRQEVLEKAVLDLTKSSKASAQVVGKVCNMADPVAAKALWNQLNDEGITVDVLVLNAASISEQVPILERGTDGIWADFAMNVRAQLDFVERFHSQTGKGSQCPKVRETPPAHETTLAACLQAATAYRSCLHLCHP